MENSLKTESINVAFAINNGFSAQAATVISSIINTTKTPEKFRFFILSSDISDENMSLLNKFKEEKNLHIEVINMNQYVNKNLENFLAKSASYNYITSETYYRFYLAEIFQNIDKIIYLDADILVLHDLSEMFDTDISEYYAGAIEDPIVEKFVFSKRSVTTRVLPELNYREYFKTKLGKDDKKYFNAGVLLLNLQKIREDKMSQKLWDFVEKESPLEYQDQDVLNAVFDKKVKYLDIKWNTQVGLPSLYNHEPVKQNQKLWKDAYINPYIIHFNGPEKPWKYDKKNKYKRKYFLSWWDEYRKTPFYNPEKDDSVFKQIKFSNKYYRLIFLKQKFDRKYGRLIENLSASRLLTKFFNLLECATPKGFSQGSQKFGLYEYSYKEDYGSGYDPEYLNIGDYVQSLAAKQYLPDTNLIKIDRDKVKNYNGEPVNLIANGWYYIFSGNSEFSEKINPLFVALHLDNLKEIPKETIKYLKQHEPIGCRDYTTRNYLILRGVKAYFSGCLTTTLDLKYKVSDNERENKVIFCDYKINTENPTEADKKLDKILKNYSDCKIEYTTQAEKLGLPAEECFEIADSLLKRYARAKLVITSRIHCALPCLAMKTPVILMIPKKYDKKRFNGISNLLNIIGNGRHRKFLYRVKTDENGRVRNPENYIKFAEILKHTAKSFVETQIKNTDSVKALSSEDFSQGGGG